MALPLKCTFGLDEAAIGETGEVTVRVLRAGFSWAFAAGGGTWQMLLPVAVVDRREGRRSVRPVIDVNLSVALAGSLLLLISARRRRRKANV
jgi:hypothetical protein